VSLEDSEYRMFGRKSAANSQESLKCSNALLVAWHNM